MQDYVWVCSTGFLYIWNKWEQDVLVSTLMCSVQPIEDSKTSMLSSFLIHYGVISLFMFFLFNSLCSTALNSFSVAPLRSASHCCFLYSLYDGNAFLLPLYIYVAQAKLGRSFFKAYLIQNWSAVLLMHCKMEMPASIISWHQYLYNFETACSSLQYNAFSTSLRFPQVVSTIYAENQMRNLIFVAQPCLISRLAQSKILPDF